MQTGIAAVILKEAKASHSWLKSCCNRSGVNIIAEAWLEQGVPPVIEQQPDLIIVDNEFEDMSGIEAARRLRSSFANKPEVMIVTSSTDPHKLMIAVNEMRAYYIVKPLYEEGWSTAFPKVLERCTGIVRQEQPPEAKRMIQIRTSRKSYPIEEHTIVMAEKVINSRNINIYLSTGDVIVSNNPLSEIKDQASEYIFESIRGILVNLRHVGGYKREAATANRRNYTIFFDRNRLTAPLGRLQEKSFAEKLKAMNGGTLRE